MSNKHLAILGGGNMGRALIGGMLRRGTRPEHITVGESSEAAREALSADFGVQATADNAAAVEPAAVIVLAVKPQVAGAVLAPLQPALQRARPVVISIAAGIRLAALESWCGAGVPVVRAMPNRPALVGAGATGLFAPASVAGTHREVAERVMQAVGEVIWVGAEDDLDVVTALSGSGPAYFFLVAELLTQGAIDLGLDPAAARRLAIATLHGSGQLAHAGDGDLARMRAEVTSKGGTTEAAVKSFEAADLRGIVARALEAATRRSRELAAQFGAQ
ncbi:MAG: pyrroline-5-carboxylate reductase [Gammaproteobacteria bacterium]|jgi:pyrroline-5-carboxylate reductase|nr:pyrroline-5-carboxylate reductase [Gammaproteobacteria bacterium]